MMKGGAFNIEVTVDNETTLRIVLKDESGTVLSANSIVLSAGGTHEETLHGDWRILQL